MARRAESVDETRQRITDAAIRLHTTIGPANTTIAGIAEEAGVTRLTVYRHFPDAAVLFEACRGEWRARQPPPDPSPWPLIGDLEERARHALGALYAWYGSRGDDLYPIQRDFGAIPAAAQEELIGDGARMAEALVAGHVEPGPAGRRLRAVAGHVTGFWTWWTLVRHEGLSDTEAADVAVGFLLGSFSTR